MENEPSYDEPCERCGVPAGVPCYPEESVEESEGLSALYLRISSVWVPLRHFLNAQER